MREPQRFRAWVCGIARQLALNYVRKRARRSDRAPDLETLPEVPSPEVGPDQLAVSEEEKELLWRALQRLPHSYREPMVLFYREQQSLIAVAQALELSEDAVKQRLSRGRVLLRQEQSRVLKGVLGATRPGVAFTLAVVGALPPLLTATGVAVTASTAQATPAGGASMAASGVALGAAVASIVSGVVGLLGLYVAYRLWRSPGVLPATRKILVRLAIVSGSVLVCFAAAVAWIAGPGGPLLVRRGLVGPQVLTILIVAFILVNMALSSFAAHKLMRAQKQAMVLREGLDPTLNPLYRRYRSHLRFLGLPLVEVAHGADPSKGAPRGVARAWIAIGDVAWGGLISVGTFSCAPISVGTVAVGLVSMGGFAAGALCVGGIALGWLSVGSLAVADEYAIGGFAVAHRVAVGGVALSRTWAIGGNAFAAHANDAAALAWLHNGSLLDHLMRLLPYSGWLSLLGVPGMYFALRRIKRLPTKTAV